MNHPPAEYRKIKYQSGWNVAIPGYICRDLKWKIGDYVKIVQLEDGVKLETIRD